jgi:hypothetical protein
MIRAVFDGRAIAVQQGRGRIQLRLYFSDSPNGPELVFSLPVDVAAEVARRLAASLEGVQGSAGVQGFLDND